MIDPRAWAGLEFVKVSGPGLVPRVPDGAIVGVDTASAPVPGDTIVVRVRRQRLVAELREWDGVRWLAWGGREAPRRLDASVEVVGVVRLVIYSLERREGPMQTILPAVRRPAEERVAAWLRANALEEAPCATAIARLLADEGAVEELRAGG